MGSDYGLPAVHVMVMPRRRGEAIYYRCACGRGPMGRGAMIQHLRGRQHGGSRYAIERHLDAARAATPSPDGGADA